MIPILSHLNPMTEGAILFISVVGLSFQLRWTRRGAALGPTLLTTLGIFFCFLGIALGLADFDPNDVKSSVPHLLQGIRTSFWSSVCGIGWALTIKIRLAVFGEAANTAHGIAHHSTIDDLATHLMRLNTVIGDQDEASLLSQVRLLRQDANVRLERLQGALESHAQGIAEANAQALLQALSEVVKQFNSRLNEQFGDNFKELNVAVGRLVVWQSQYERQLESLIAQETATRQSMTLAAERYSEVVGRSTVFVETAHALSGIMGTLEAERERLAAGLAILAGLIDTASTGLPQIEKSIVDMTHQIARGVQSNQETLTAALKTSWQSIQVHNQHLSAMLAKSLEAANKDLANHARQSQPDSQPSAVA